MSTIKRADEVRQGEWIRVGQQAFRVGRITRPLDLVTGTPADTERLEFLVGRGGHDFRSYAVDTEVEVVALVDPDQAAALDRVHETLARFREHAAEIMPDRDENAVDFTGEAAEMEADTWLAAADELRIALGLPHPDQGNDEIDTEGSASRQHYIETGRYLRVGEDQS